MSSQNQHILRIATTRLGYYIIPNPHQHFPALVPHVFSKTYVVRFSIIETTLISAITVVPPAIASRNAVPFASEIPAMMAASAPAAPARADLRPNWQLPRDMRAILPERDDG
ncbi:MAG: hypothetical protein Q9225_005900 [Loekoesia sp. 1 TL-2023]